MVERFDETLADKDKVVWKLVSGIDELNTKWNTSGISDAEKALIDTQVKAKLADIAKIEWEAQHIATKLFSENEKQMVGILNHAWLKRTAISGLLHHIPSFSNGINWVKWNQSVPEHLKEINLFSPERKYLRFGSVGTGIALIGIGASIAGYTSADGHGVDAAKVTAKRIAAGFIPVYGTGLDFQDAWESLNKWELWNALANATSGVVSGVGDAILGLSIVTGIGAPVGAGAKAALAGIAKSIKAGMIVESVSSSAEVFANWGKVIMKLKDVKTGKIVEETLTLTEEQTGRFAQFSEMMASWRKWAEGWQAILTGKNGKRMMIGGALASVGFAGVPLVSAYMEGGKLQTVAQKID